MTMSPRLATFLMFVVNGAVIGTWVASIPAIKRDLGVSDGEFGLALLFAPMGALVAQQITGQLLVRVSSQRLLVVSALAYPLLVVLPIAAPSIPLLILALFIFGYASTTMDVTMNAHGVGLEGSGGKSIMSGLHAGWSLGAVIGSVGVAIALSRAIEPVAEAFLAGILLWLLALAASRFLGTGTTRTESAKGLHLPTRAVLPLAGLIILIAFVEGGLTDWGGIYMDQGVGADESIAALAFAAFSVGLFAGRIGGDWTKDRIGSIRLTQWGMLLAAGSIAAFLLVPDRMGRAGGDGHRGRRHRQHRAPDLRCGRTDPARRPVAVGRLHLPDADLHGRPGHHRHDLGPHRHRRGLLAVRRRLGGGGGPGTACTGGRDQPEIPGAALGTNGGHGAGLMR